MWLELVQVALGHDQPSTKLETYSHLWPSDDDRLREAIDRTWVKSIEDI